MFVFAEKAIVLLSRLREERHRSGPGNSGVWTILISRTARLGNHPRYFVPLFGSLRPTALRPGGSKNAVRRSGRDKWLHDGGQSPSFPALLQPHEITIELRHVAMGSTGWKQKYRRTCWKMPCWPFQNNGYISKVGGCHDVTVIGNRDIMNHLRSGPERLGALVSLENTDAVLSPTTVMSMGSAESVGAATPRSCTSPTSPGSQSPDLKPELQVTEPTDINQSVG